MSKNITIQEGGVARTMSNVEKLQTALVGGGSCYWVPEDERQVTTKHITQNGTYQASSDGVYGYSQVTVNVSGGNGSADSGGRPSGGDILPGGIGSAVVGTDPDTGNEEVVGVDEDGNLVTTPIPSYIEVTRLPDKTEYQVGETINPTGIIVHAYYADGTDYGTVLNSELVYPVQVAPEPGGAGGGDYALLPKSDDLSFASTVSNGLCCGESNPGKKAYDLASSSLSGVGYVFYSHIGTRTGVVYAISAQDYNALAADTDIGSWAWQNSDGTQNAFGTIKKSKFSVHADNPNVYCYVTTWMFPPENRNQSVPYYQTEGAALDALRDFAPSGNVSIPVQWVSPFNGKTLEDSFEIAVTSSGGTTVDDEGFSGSEGNF